MTTIKAVVALALTVGAAGDQLPIPSDRLPAGCVLADRRSGYTGLQLPTNPWSGTNPSLIAEIRERIEGSPRPPDGPPMSPREAARFRLRLADGIENASVAVYQDSDSKLLIPVYGIQFVPGEKPIARRNTTNPEIVRVTIGSMNAAALGRGPCFDAIAAFLKSQADK